MGLTGFDWVLLGLTGFYRVLLGFTEFYRVWLGFTGFPPSGTGLYRVVLATITWCDRVRWTSVTKSTEWEMSDRRWSVMASKIGLIKIHRPQHKNSTNSKIHCAAGTFPALLPSLFFFLFVFFFKKNSVLFLFFFRHQNAFFCFFLLPACFLKKWQLLYLAAVALMAYHFFYLLFLDYCLFGCSGTKYTRFDFSSGFFSFSSIGWGSEWDNCPIRSQWR